MCDGEKEMNLISKETLLTHLQRAEMASDVRLPIEFFRDLIYQAMPRTWVSLTEEEIKAFDTWHDNREEEKGWVAPSEIVAYLDTKFKEKNFD
jgi:hypothetical protein